MATKNAPWEVVAQMQFAGTQPEGKLVIGYGVASETGRYAAQIAKGPALVVADPIVEKLGKLSEICQSLREAGFAYDVFSNVEPEPHLSSAAELVALVRSKSYGLVVGVGGGSALDTAKLAALMAVTDGCAEDVFKNPSLAGKTLPKILISTTSGTGSEVSPYIVMTDDHGKKLFIGTGALYATVALVDPGMAQTMPPKVTAATGLDALTHGIEGMTGATTPYTLALGGKCAELVFAYLPRAVENGDDREARYYMAYASVMGMMAYTQGGGLYAHSMSYLLTVEKGLAHGAGCGLALPYTTAFTGDFAPEVNATLRKVLGTENVPGRLLELLGVVHMPQTLRQIGYERDQLERLAGSLIEAYYRPRNPRPMALENSIRLMQNMYQGSLDF